MNRTALSWSAYAGMFVFGIVMALIGAILPALSGRLEFGLADIGTLFLAMNLAMLVCSSFIGVAMDRFGMKPPLVAGPVLVAAALVLIVRAERFDGLIPAVVLLGIGGGALNAATNTLIADINDDPRRKSAALNILGVFFGLGALFIPFSISMLMSAFGIGALLVGAAGLCLGAAVFAGLLDYPPPKQQHRLPVREMSRFLTSPLVAVMSLLLFFESGMEFTLGGYLSTYLGRAFSFTVEAASLVLAGYWASIMTARIVLSRVLRSANPALVVVLCAACAAAANFVMALALNGVVAGIAACLAGFALAGVFPTTLGIAGSRFRDFSGTVFGILFTAALTGGTMLPWVAGRIATAAGLHWVFGFAALAFAAIAALGGTTRRLSR
jgi:FHS family glucose/mannose:H+ symporter-like MFS transporter